MKKEYEKAEVKIYELEVESVLQGESQSLSQEYFDPETMDYK